MKNKYPIEYIKTRLMLEALEMPEVKKRAYEIGRGADYEATKQKGYWYLNEMQAAMTRSVENGLDGLPLLLGLGSLISGALGWIGQAAAKTYIKETAITNRLSQGLESGDNIDLKTLLKIGGVLSIGAVGLAWLFGGFKNG